MAVATAAKSGLTALDAARLLFEVDKPTTAEKEKARRKLEKLTRQGVLRLIREGDKDRESGRRLGAVVTYHGSSPDLRGTSGPDTRC